MTFFSGAGVHLIERIRNRLRMQGSSLLLINPFPTVRRVLRIVGSEDLLPLSERPDWSGSEGC